MPTSRILAAALLFLLGFHNAPAQAPSPDRVIVDTDIGDDIDDAFAVSLALTSPEISLAGISSSWGDTALRARMIDRMLCETGRDSIAVNAGVPTRTTTTFSQAPWARAGIARTHGDAIAFLLDQIRTHPHQLTLLALGPLTNLGAAIDRDPATFRQLRRVVLMGGSVHRGYGVSNAPPEPEYNIARDPAAAQKLFRSGVPIFMLPLDSTQLKFDEAKRSQLASVSTPLTDSLEVLIAEWSRSSHTPTPTLFDVVAAAYAISPETCPMTPLHIEVDDKGMTLPTEGSPNAQVCLQPHPEALFHLLMPRLLHQHMTGNKVCVARSVD
ncbi:nucleoside hydrolase [Edaphobacter sp. 12200R-103]|uniref:nucleoside hydrolase n=1 Tax=Edaphobacter sp. 12200R-103 TaxID=2703788 RepID=UPI00138B1E16|nr:nucleoside hydrolase [Edaphobacter sp. 12200R-103]QHS52723.1 nucleoside hydrolase [Edaphobacter sp. 12200R-103]